MKPAPIFEAAVRNKLVVSLQFGRQTWTFSLTERVGSLKIELRVCCRL